LWIGIGYGERHAFPGVVQTNDDELAGTLFPGDPRRLDLKKLNVSRQGGEQQRSGTRNSSTIDSAGPRPNRLGRTSQAPGCGAQWAKPTKIAALRLFP
jgi:hypothetical protein